ncbi:hypothetical protein [Staphylococcus haemolyticus]
MGLLVYGDGEKGYIIVRKGLEVGEVVESGGDGEIKVGKGLGLEKIGVGSVIDNMELKAGKGGELGG